jgi:electron transport complex protein RnfG
MNLLRVVIAGVCAGQLLAARAAEPITNAPAAAGGAQALDADQSQALAAVLPPHDNDPLAQPVTIADNGKSWTFFTARRGGKIVGTAFLAVSRLGYGGDIQVMVGVTNGLRVARLAILPHHETPGLGDKIGAPQFYGQFAGRDLARTRWALRKDGGDIDGITGATVSSRAVVDAVRRGLEVCRRHAAEIGLAGE